MSSKQHQQQFIQQRKRIWIPFLMTKHKTHSLWLCPSFPQILSLC